MEFRYVKTNLSRRIGALSAQKVCPHRIACIGLPAAAYSQASNAAKAMLTTVELSSLDLALVVIPSLVRTKRLT